jgi:hypothetical protein
LLRFAEHHSSGDTASNYISRATESAQGFFRASSSG